MQAIKDWYSEIGSYKYRSHAAVDGNGESFYVLEVYFPEEDIWMYVDTYVDTFVTYTGNIKGAYRFKDTEEARAVGELAISRQEYIDKHNRITLL